MQCNGTTLPFEKCILLPCLNISRNPIRITPNHDDRNKFPGSLIRSTRSNPIRAVKGNRGACFESHLAFVCIQGCRKYKLLNIKVFGIKGRSNGSYPSFFSNKNHHLAFNRQKKGILAYNREKLCTLANNCHIFFLTVIPG